MLGMVAALLLIWVGFDISSGILRALARACSAARFLTPRNLWILLVQTSSIAVMTTGMVLIIVMRQHRPVGRLDARLRRRLHRHGCRCSGCGPCFGVGHPVIWIVTLILGIAARVLPSVRFHGTLIAYLGIPSFIVTLGGLIVWRGAAWR